MPWFQLAFKPGVLTDLARPEKAFAQRLLDKSKWLASNVANLRHEPIATELPGMSKYAVGDWRIFYTIDREDQVVTVHAIVDRKALA